MTINEESWSSSAIPPPRQLPGFQEVLDRTHFHWDLKGQGEDGYLAKVRRRAVDDFIFTRIVADPIKGFRTASDIRKGAEDYFCLLFFEGGQCGLSQGRNESWLKKDHIAIWDSARPAMFEAPETIFQVSILIPHRTATTIVPGIEDMCGKSVDGATGLGAILLSHLKQVHAMIDTIAPGDRPAVLRATVELVAAAFRPALADTSGSTFRRALVNRVQEHILANLGDPELTPAGIAAAFKFSPRYLHRLFEEFDFTVGDWIRRRRLHAAKVELASRTSDGITVTEVAMRYGFSDASHFSHAFKEEFSISPRDFRQRAREAAGA